MRYARYLEKTHLSAQVAERVRVPAAVMIDEAVRVDIARRGFAAVVVIANAHGFARALCVDNRIDFIGKRGVALRVAVFHYIIFVIVRLAFRRPSVFHGNQLIARTGGCFYVLHLGRRKGGDNHVQFLAVQKHRGQTEFFTHHYAAAVAAPAVERNARRTEHVYIPVNGAYGNFQLGSKFRRGHLFAAYQFYRH